MKVWLRQKRFLWDNFLKIVLNLRLKQNMILSQNKTVELD